MLKMSGKYQFLLLILIFTMSSCINEKRNKQFVLKFGDIDKLEENIEKFVGKEGQITPDIALNSIVETSKLKDQVSLGTKTKENPIDLYVTYSVDYWSEYNDVETFEITFAHQTLEGVNNKLFEYRITLIYNFEPFEKIEEFSLKFPIDEKDLKSFEKTVRSSLGFEKASTLRTGKIEISKETI